MIGEKRKRLKKLEIKPLTLKSEMKKIFVRNFGPITQCSNGGFEISPITVFCGNQGSGKSTIAKLISTFSWIEKALVRGDFTETELLKYDRFRKKHCAYHNIHNYFKKDTELKYSGEMYDFCYKSEHLSCKKTGQNYSMPQIMYVPAERNFMSAIENAERIKKLPSSLATMLEEFEKAKRYLPSKIKLPIGDFFFQYDKLNKVSWLAGNDFKVRLSEAASGFQSIIPLLLTTSYLSGKLNQNTDGSIKSLSYEEQERLSGNIKKLLLDETLNEDTKKALLSQLNDLFINKCFLNIVEEPEQNLFPSSQQNVLNELLAVFNKNKGNSLIITTHSPYIINDLSIAIKAGKIKEYNNTEVNKQLDSIIPLNSTVHNTQVAIYQITDSGNVEQLEFYNEVPTDDNYLNNFLENSNDVFSKLIELEEQCQ